MIVRIMGAGQWQVPDDVVRRLNVLDELVYTAVQSRDADDLAAVLTEMADLVKRVGTQMPASPIVLSDLIVPNRATSLKEIGEWLQESSADDGLIPG